MLVSTSQRRSAMKRSQLLAGSLWRPCPGRGGGSSSPAGESLGSRSQTAGVPAGQQAGVEQLGKGGFARAVDALEDDQLRHLRPRSRCPRPWRCLTMSSSGSTRRGTAMASLIGVVLISLPRKPDHVAEFALDGGLHGVVAETGGQDAVIGSGAAAALHVAQDGEAALDAGHGPRSGCRPGRRCRPGGSGRWRRRPGGRRPLRRPRAWRLRRPRPGRSACPLAARSRILAQTLSMLIGDLGDEDDVAAAGHARLRARSSRRSGPSLR